MPDPELTLGNSGKAHIQAAINDLASGGSFDIPGLPAASALDGSELVPVVQGGATKRTTAQAIADLGGGGGNWWETVAPSGQGIVWRNAADDGDVTGPTLLGMEFTSAPGNVYDVEEVAEGLYFDKNYGGYYGMILGVFAAFSGGMYDHLFDETLDDPDHLQVSYYRYDGPFLAGQYAAADALIGLSPIMSQTSRYWDGAASQNWNTSILHAIADNSPLDAKWLLQMTGFDGGVLTFDQDGIPSFPELPTSDPGVVGQLYEAPVTHAVTVSQGP